MEVVLKYGQEGLKVKLRSTPGFVGVLAPKEAPVLQEPGEAVAASLVAPIESPGLKEVAKGKEKVCVVISDNTRPVPNELILTALLQQFEEAGIRQENITILIATGIHAPNLGDELVQLVGKDIAANYQVVNHYSKQKEDMVLVGELDDGTPVYINKIYIEADLKVLTGFIEPHMWAGFSGGRKSILPGISSIETLEYMHGPKIVAHEKAAYGVLAGNPFHEYGLKIMEKAGADFIVNVTLNTKKQVTGVFSGHPVEAHLKGCDFLAQFCVHTLPEPLDFIVTTNSGAPLDCNLYQTSKGITAAADGLKPGGAILIASQCDKKFGSEEYVEVMDMVDTPQNFIDRLVRGDFFIPDQWCAQETYQVMLKHEILIYSDGISDADLKKYRFKPIHSVEKAIDGLLERFGENAKWAVIPDGPMLMLKVG